MVIVGEALDVRAKCVGKHDLFAAVGKLVGVADAVVFARHQRGAGSGVAAQESVAVAGQYHALAGGERDRGQGKRNTGGERGAGQVDIDRADVHQLDEFEEIVVVEPCRDLPGGRVGGMIHELGDDQIGSRGQLRRSGVFDRDGVGSDHRAGEVESLQGVDMGSEGEGKLNLP